MANSDSNNTISAADNISSGDSLVSTFKAACNVWSMLHSDSTYSKGKYIGRSRLKIFQFALCFVNKIFEGYDYRTTVHSTQSKSFLFLELSFHNVQVTRFGPVTPNL